MNQNEIAEGRKLIESGKLPDVGARIVKALQAELKGDDGDRIAQAAFEYANGTGGKNALVSLVNYGATRPNHMLNFGARVRWKGGSMKPFKDGDELQAFMKDIHYHVTMHEDGKLPEGACGSNSYAKHWEKVIREHPRFRKFFAAGLKVECKGNQSSVSIVIG